MITHNSGASSELLACHWLLENGYEVFRNVSPAGPIDIVIRNPKTGCLYLLDVKRNGGCLHEGQEDIGVIKFHASPDKPMNFKEGGATCPYQLPSHYETLLEMNKRERLNKRRHG